MSRARQLVNNHIDGAKTARLEVGTTSVLFFDSVAVAVRAADSDTFVLDTEHSRAAVKAINSFANMSTGGHQIRTAGSEFDFVLATSIMSQLRTLTRGNINAAADAS